MAEKKLNPEQLMAIKHGKGPLLIIAGAGTGKTTVITERIKYLIAKGLAAPSEILGLTFTEKAARELEIRVDEALPYGYTQMWLVTFHSFCDRVLRAEGLHVGMDPKYKLTTEAEATQLIRKNLFAFDLDYFRPLGNPNKYIAGMLQHFSRLADEDISPVEYFNWVKRQTTNNKQQSEEDKLENKKWFELASAYKTYEEMKVKYSYLDFGDLIANTLHLFRTRPNILKKYQTQFKYILVDEYQDTNYSQNELVKLLCKKHGNITVVADDDQAIYRWRGASISNVVQFRKSFPKTKVIALTKNYRSSQEILDRSYDLIQNNNPDRLEVVEKISKRLISQVSSKGDSIEFMHVDRVENEAEKVARKISELTTLEKSRYDYKDFAILVRANNHADSFVRALTRAGIPHQFLGPGKLFKQPEIVDLISFLRVLYDSEDSTSFFRFLSCEHFDIAQKDLISMASFARRKSMDLFEVAQKHIGDLSLGKNTVEIIKKLTKTIEESQTVVNKETAGQILYNFLESTDLIQKIFNPDTAYAEKRASNISKFFDKLKSYEVDHEDASVFAVIDWIDLATELGESPLAADSDWTDINAVNILTIHSAKGLEFPVVFLVNLVSQRFPSMQRSEQIPIPDDLVKEILPKGDFHLQEERRLFYVGMTRAKERLFFTAADYYGEGKREKKLSPFIFEALGNQVVSSEQMAVDSQQMSLLSFQNHDSEQFTSNHQLPTSNFHIDYLSVSQIETFQICPMHYKLRYIYKVPTAPSASASFGTTIHNTLKNFYEEVACGAKPTDKNILKIYSSNWIDEGYTSKAQKNKFFDRGKIYLKGYLKNGFDPKRKTIALEQSFTMNLLNAVDLKKFGARPLKIGGKIDRVDDLGNGVIEIIDYKTSAKISTQKEVDKNLQLSFYAFAAAGVTEFPFGRKPEKIVLSLYFLDNQEKISTVRTLDDLQKEKEKILKIREEIETSEFPCSANILCKSCDYKLFCSSE